MRHNKKSGMKLGTDASHTKAMKRGLLCALFLNDRIKTLDSRAKAIRSDADKIVTWAKRGDLAARRLAIAKMGDKELVREVFEKAAQGLWADRNGGYTRIIKLGPRKGDAAEVVIMEIVTESVQPKAKDTSKSARVVTGAPKLSRSKGTEDTAEDGADASAAAPAEEPETAEAAPVQEPEAVSETTETAPEAGE